MIERRNDIGVLAADGKHPFKRLSLERSYADVTFVHPLRSHGSSASRSIIDAQIHVNALFPEFPHGHEHTAVKIHGGFAR